MGGILSAVGDVVSAPFKAVGDLIKAPIDLFSGHPGQALGDIGNAIVDPLKGVMNAGKDILSDPLSAGLLGGVGGFLVGGPIGALIGGGLGAGIGQQFQMSQALSQFQNQQKADNAALSKYLNQSGYMPGGAANTNLYKGLGL